MKILEVTENDIIQRWKSKTSTDTLNYYCTRDNCGPAVLDFINFAKQRGLNLRRVEGEFIANEVVHDKNDFTDKMKNEFLQSGLNWDSDQDRKQWIENSKYADEWIGVPHYWAVDKNNKVYDPIGFEQFIKTGLATDLNINRYKEN